MPVIAIAYFDRKTNKFKALTCACTQKEFKHYMETGDILNECTVSGTFIRGYLSDKGYSDVKLQEIRRASIITENGYLFEWLNSSVITIPNLKEVLHYLKFDDYFHDCIDAYAEHLKSL